MAKKYSFMDVPVGANKRYLVICGGEPFAGFDTLTQANLYISIQKSKIRPDGKPTVASQKTWNIKDMKNDEMVD